MGFTFYLLPADIQRQDSLRVLAFNRLILNLSHNANRREDEQFRIRTGLSLTTFESNPVLGNIGASLRTLPDDTSDDLEVTAINEGRRMVTGNHDGEQLHDIQRRSCSISNGPLNVNE